MMSNIKNPNTINQIYCGDCKFVMRHDLLERGIKVDLIYLDPPFFTGKVQKGIWLPGAMEVSFEDSKKFWGLKRYKSAPEWMKWIGTKRPEFASYLYYMYERLEMCNRVLKKTGSIYLHCDYRASHYLKMIMDEIFDVENLQNEIIWQRTLGHHLATGMDVMTDTILFYTKNKEFIYNKQYQKLSKKELEKKFSYIEEETSRKFTHEKLEQASNVYSKGEVRIIQGKELTTDIGWRWTQQEFDRRLQKNPYVIFWTGTGKPRYKRYADEYKGRKVGNLWKDIFPLASRSKERLGYPTQKPLRLLERIVKTSSNPFDIILDPFCGCGRSIVAAYRLGRRWIGIDLNPKACEVMQKRFESEFALSPQIIYRDLEEISKLSPLQFEQWVNEFYGATKPKPDKGVDGITPSGIPIQTKTFKVKYDVIGAFLTCIEYHPKVPKPIKRGIIVSQKGFAESAISRVFEIQEKEDILIELITPENLLENS